MVERGWCVRRPKFFPHPSEGGGYIHIIKIYIRCGYFAHLQDIKRKRTGSKNIAPLDLESLNLHLKQGDQ
ncbi:MAG: hypothetical protein D6785_09195 [Planctomycetota bacterium]|nr:MAG: hypothetical protein D6785_09195 [Planctomycetota bacterium]